MCRGAQNHALHESVPSRFRNINALEPVSSLLNATHPTLCRAAEVTPSSCVGALKFTRPIVGRAAKITEPSFLVGPLNITRPSRSRAAETYFTRFRVLVRPLISRKRAVPGLSLKLTNPIVVGRAAESRGTELCLTHPGMGRAAEITEPRCVGSR